MVAQMGPVRVAFLLAAAFAQPTLLVNNSASLATHPSGNDRALAFWVQARLRTRSELRSLDTKRRGSLALQIGRHSDTAVPGWI
jgi:hypothetical protein